MAHAAKATTGRRPNLVYVFADQLRYQSCGFAGDERAKTPNMDRMASQGVSFSNAVSTMPVCTAYRASLLTGQYPSSHGTVINEVNCRTDMRSIAHSLNDADYQVDYIGKWHLRADKNAATPPGPPRLGFDGYWATWNFNHRHYKAKYWLNDRLDAPIPIDGYEPDFQTDLAIERIEKAKGGDRPLALFLSYGAPHDPWTDANTPKRFREMFDEKDFGLPPNWSDTPDPYMDRGKDPKAWLKHWKPNLPLFQKNYYAASTAVDWNLGRVMKALEDAGMSDNTILVFTSDHGEMFGAQGRQQKLTFYEEAARVPFLVRWPARIPEGRVSDACLGTVDIMPTLLGLMGIEGPDTVEGMDLSPLARGESGPEPEAAFLQGMGHTHQWIDGAEWRALRDKRYTYGTYLIDGSELLFDNQADPYQMKNLVDDPEHAETLARFRAMLKAKMASLNDTFEKCTWYRDHWTDGDLTVLRGAKGADAPAS